MAASEKKKLPRTITRKMKSRENNQVSNLLMIGHLYSKKTTKQKTNKKRVKSWLKNCLHTSELNNVFAEVMVNGKERFLWYLRANTSYHVSCVLKKMGSKKCILNLMKKHFIFPFSNFSKYIFFQVFVDVIDNERIR